MKISHGLDFIDGVAVSDEALDKFENGVEFWKKDEVTTYDDVILNQAEKDKLLLPPEHQVYPRLTSHKIGVEMEKYMAK